MPPLRHHRGSLQTISARYQVKTGIIYQISGHLGFSVHQPPSFFPHFSLNYIIFSLTNPQTPRLVILGGMHPPWTRYPTLAASSFFSLLSYTFGIASGGSTFAYSFVAFDQGVLLLSAHIGVFDLSQLLVTKPVCFLCWAREDPQGAFETDAIFTCSGVSYPAYSLLELPSSRSAA